jgi:hypothetical protein
LCKPSMLLLPLASNGFSDKFESGNETKPRKSDSCKEISSPEHKG